MNPREFIKQKRDVEVTEAFYDQRAFFDTSFTHDFLNGPGESPSTNHFGVTFSPGSHLE